MKINSKTGEWEDPRDRHLCSFGVIEGLAVGIGSLAAGAGAGAGTAAVIGGIGAGALTGAAGGAALGAITGGDPGMGALTGALSGGSLGAFGGAGGLVDSFTGLGATGSDALIGGAAGLVGAGITGGNPVTSGLTGAVSGAVTGALGDSLSPSGASASGATAPGTSAAAVAPPPGVGTIADLTATAGGAGAGTGGLAIQGGLDGFGGATGAASSGDFGALGGGAAAGGGSANLGSLISTAGGGAGGGLAITGGTDALGGGGNIVSPSVSAPAGATAPPNTISTAWNNPTAGNIFKAVGANAAPLVAGAGLVGNLLTPNNLTGETQLKDQAGALLTQGNNLASYLTSGKLPPGAQAGLDQATKAAQASIRSKYASMGMSGSTAETQDLNNILLQAQAQSFQIADSLLKTGIDETGLATGIYENLANLDQQQSNATGSAIASLAAAMAGGTTINIGGHA